MKNHEEHEEHKGILYAEAFPKLQLLGKHP
jgi:hypothetical protein